uniref:Uncharacterized protein n=1 Tax=Picea sitchensis TaxID=3332 RepID=A9P0A8_PICSI|nr:unknown [Picea sitchensis]
MTDVQTISCTISCNLKFLFGVSMEMEAELSGINDGSNNIITSIIPPRLEDAGLEDCALSAEGIKEAFLRAAEAMKSKASNVFHDGECIEDTGSSNGEWTDSLEENSRIPNEADESQSCVGSRVGGLVEEGTDKLVDLGSNEVQDEVIDAQLSVKHPGEDGACVQGLEGMEEDKDRADHGEEEGPTPALAETYV